MMTRNQPDLTFCEYVCSRPQRRPTSRVIVPESESLMSARLLCLCSARIILMEMEAHSDAWPFLEPVNPRLVPGYRRIIKNPMDFLTMRERLLQGG